MKQENSFKTMFTSWKVWCGVAIVLAIVLLIKGTGLYSIFPYMLFLICPVMMLVMMGEHKHK